ncbi:hypothetical protein LHL20_04115 [Alteromonas sp. McT4-15]|uniref:hypothetical protein n=1 Tax=Alteromonas sp. McT4-15 TaxID=2881256 RepID=UPI001CF90CC3|nr:hypothetical protein [Alteromonas sp. McT4-15]MCB4435427.1 hypothetical protein [Alteromonas sp. McT4-15]
MLKQITRYILPVVLTISVSGCTSAPKTTHADIPLVHSSLAYSLTPDSEHAINIPKANLLFNNQESFEILFNGQQYNAYKYYISATGNKCIRFMLQDSGIQKTEIENRLTTCQRNGQWKVIAPLVEPSSLAAK